MVRTDTKMGLVSLSPACGWCYGRRPWLRRPTCRCEQCYTRTQWVMLSYLEVSSSLALFAPMISWRSQVPAA